MDRNDGSCPRTVVLLLTNDAERGTMLVTTLRELFGYHAFMASEEAVILHVLQTIVPDLILLDAPCAPADHEMLFRYVRCLKHVHVPPLLIADIRRYLPAMRGIPRHLLRKCLPLCFKDFTAMLHEVLVA